MRKRLMLFRRAGHIASMIALLALAGAILLAQSQQPAPSPPKGGQNQQRPGGKINNAPSSQQATADNAAGPNQAEPFHQEFVIQQTGGQKDDESSTNRWLVILTAALVVVGGLQVASVVWQNKIVNGQNEILREQRTIMSGQLSADQVSADAAKNGADAARGALALMREKERAYIDMSHHPPGLRPSDFIGTKMGAELVSGDQLTRAVLVCMAIHNYGNTRGVVTARFLDAFFYPAKAPLPTNPPYDNARAVTVRLAVMPGGPLHFSEKWKIPESKWAEVQRGEQVLYLIGYVDYMDQFGGRHRAGYARRYDPHASDYSGIYARDADGAIVRVPDETLANNNLPYVTELSYNRDRPRKKGEGNDWDEPEKHAEMDDASLFPT